MEPGVREFLRRIMLSIFLGFSWMMINIIAGIKYNLAFLEGPVKIGNILFYIWFITSLVLLFLLFRKVWREPISHDF
jgi:hypothetical protein